jgi:hypothetical protein
MEPKDLFNAFFREFKWELLLLVFFTGTFSLALILRAGNVFWLAPGFLFLGLTILIINRTYIRRYGENVQARAFFKAFFSEFRTEMLLVSLIYVLFGLDEIRVSSIMPGLFYLAVAFAIFRRTFLMTDRKK